MKNQRSVLHVIVSMNPEAGGLPQAVNLMIAGLSKIGVFSEIVSLDQKSDPFIRSMPHTIHAVGPRSGPWGYSKYLRPFLRDNLSRFDAVILHGLWQYTGFALYKAMEEYSRNKSSEQKWAKPKFLVMPHGMLDPYFQKAKDRKIKAIRNWLFWKLIEKSIVKAADEILFTCKEEQLLAQHTFTPYNPARETVVGLGILPPPNNTVDIGQAFYNKCPAVKNYEYIFFLSRINIKKGVDILLKAYKNLYLSYNQENLSNVGTIIPKLVIAGPGWTSNYGKELQRLVNNDIDLKGNVFLVDMLHGEEKWGGIYNCEAFILPSHQENYGIAVVEALSCSKPVLISNKINIWREIQETGGGLVADDTIIGTQSNLERWIKMPKAMKMQMSQNAGVTFREYFSLEQATESLVKSL